MNLVKKYTTLSVTKKAALWFLLANFFTKGISFITVPFFTNYLSTEEFGKYNVFLTYQGILIILSTFEMYSGAYTRGVLKYKDNIAFFTYSEQMLSTLMTIGVFVICLPFMPWLIEKTGTGFSSLLIMFGYFLVFPSYQCWINLKRFEYDYLPVVISTVIYSVLSTIVPLIAVITIEQIASVRIFYMLLMQLLVCIPFYLLNFKPIRLLAELGTVKKQWKYMLKFQAPLAVHGLSYIALSSLDRLMIEEMTGSSDVGVYSLASTIASVIMILCISANQVLKPWRYKKLENYDYKQIKEYSAKLLIGFGVLILLWILVAPDVIHIFFKPEYYDSIWAIPPLSMSVFFVFMYSMFVDVEEFFYKTKYVLFATTVSALVNVVLNYFGIGIFGYIVCSYTTLISYALLAFMHLIFSGKACKEKSISITQVFDVNNMCYCSIILLFVGIVVTLAYNYNIVRYIIILLVMVLCLINAKKNKSMISVIIKGDA